MGVAPAQASWTAEDSYPDSYLCYLNSYLDSTRYLEIATRYPDSYLSLSWRAILKDSSKVALLSYCYLLSFAIFGQQNGYLGLSSR